MYPGKLNRKTRTTFAALSLIVLLLMVEVGSNTAQAQTKPGKPGANFATVSWVTGGTGVLLGVGCAVLEPCPAAVTVGGAALGGLGALTGGLFALTPYHDPPVMPGDLSGGAGGPGMCDLACQVAKQDTPPPSTTGDDGCSVWWGCMAEMKGARLAVQLPPSHPVRNVLRIVGSLAPRPDLRGIALNAIQSNLLAPRFRQLPRSLRRR